MSPARRISLPLAVLAALTAGVLVAGASPALAANAAWWRVGFTASPSLLPRHTAGVEGEALITVTATDVGEGRVHPETEPVLLTDRLPAGVTAENVTTTIGTGGGSQCSGVHTQTVTCEFTQPLPPFVPYTMFITPRIEVTEPSATSLADVVSVSGGETPPASFGEDGEQALRLQGGGGQATPFGVEAYELTPEAQGGSLDLQAGSHPFQLSTRFDLNSVLEYYPTPSPAGFYPSVAALPQNLHFKLPPGLVASTTVAPQCSMAAFSTVTGAVNACPPDTAIGVASVLANLPNIFRSFRSAVPVFNLVPSPGEPARFGFEVEKALIVLRTSLIPGGDYAAEVSTDNTTELAQFLNSLVTIWGTPGDPAHNPLRGWACLDGEPSCTAGGEASPSAFLTLPTSCTPFQTTVSGNSWPTGEPGNQGGPLAPENTAYSLPFTLSGCNTLEFDPSLTIEPESSSASTPTGLNAVVEMPQPGLTSPGGDAEAALKETTVTLPPGLQLNPAAATGLAACSAGEFDLLDAFGEPFGEDGVAEEAQTGNETTPSGPADCPDASKVGTVTITTPLLGEPVTGSVYLARQNTDPFKTPLALYLLAEAPQAGVRVKLAGEVQVNQSTGQLTSTFRNTPQLPFTALHLHFFGGSRASLATPAVCGPATTTSAFVPWSGEAPAHPESTFQVTSGAGGAPCPPSPLSFAPSFTAGPSSPLAGAFSPFVVDIGKPDGDQPLTGISVTLPPGFAAVLASVTPCPEPPAGQEWSCGEDSHIGEVREYAGLGSEPVVLTGQAYLTNGYDGAPFGLLVRTLAAAGPFDLGWVNVRNRINVNPSTAQVTVTSDPGPRGEAIPTILDGVPVQLKALEVAVNRPSFDFNPTNCEPLTATATLSGSEGAGASLSAPFKAEGCQSLPFHPALEASTGAQGSKADGASLTVKVTSQGLGVANIQKVFLTIPKILPSRLQPTLQHACLAATFESNPAACDEDSVIGTATVRTPVLKTPLTGPVYVVSHGGAAFPDVEFVLQAEGITIVLDGKTDIKNGVTYSRFESAPDAPFTSFETVLPTGPHSILAVNTEEAPNYNLCTHQITIPTTITAQDGATLEQTTKVNVTGCAAVKSYKASRAQLLAKALKACKKDSQKRKRLACEKAARKKYATKASKKKKKTHPPDHRAQRSTPARSAGP